MPLANHSSLSFFQKLLSSWFTENSKKVNKQKKKKRERNQCFSWCCSCCCARLHLLLFFGSLSHVGEKCWRKIFAGLSDAAGSLSVFVRLRQSALIKPFVVLLNRSCSWTGVNKTELSSRTFPSHKLNDS